MSCRAVVAVMDLPVNVALSPVERLLLLLLADCTNEEDGRCFIASETVAQRAGLSPAEAAEGFARLCRKGWLAPETRAVPAEWGFDNEFRFTVQLLPSMSEEPV